MFFSDYIADAKNIELPDKFHWYLLRTADLTIASSPQKVFVYTHFPGFIFWSGVQPPKPEGWEGTLISRSGIIGPPQHLRQPGFLEFLFDRTKSAMGLMANISERQRGQIGHTFLNNQENMATSKSFEVYSADEAWKQYKKTQ